MDLTLTRTQFRDLNTAMRNVVDKRDTTNNGIPLNISKEEVGPRVFIEENLRSKRKLNSSEILRLK